MLRGGDNYRVRKREIKNKLKVNGEDRERTVVENKEQQNWEWQNQ